MCVYFVNSIIESSHFSSRIVNIWNSLPDQVVDLALLIYLKHASIIFGVVKTLCLIGQPTLPESETDQSLLCLMNRVS